MANCRTDAHLLTVLFHFANCTILLQAVLFHFPLSYFYIKSDKPHTIPNGPITQCTIILVKNIE